jgi:hypothetical protein
MKRPPIDEFVRMVQSTVAHRGITTAVGAVAGNSIIDAGLIGYGAGSYIGFVLEINPGEDDTVDAHVITAFNNATGEITVDDNFKGGQVLAGINYAVNIPSPNISASITGKPSGSLAELWQSEVGIPEARWGWTDPATGVPWNIATLDGLRRVYTTPNANEVARMRSTQQWKATPAQYGANSLIKALNLEFIVRFTNVANIDNAISVFGLTPNNTDTRASNNIIAFALVADALQTVTDLAGVETTNTGFGETLTNINKLKIRVSAGQVQFYLNEALIATHVANLPDYMMYVNHYLDTEAGGTATYELCPVSAWYEYAGSDALLEWLGWAIETLQGGGATVQSIYDLLMTSLDLARSPDSATTLTTGAEQDLYNEDGGGFPFYFAGGMIDLSNQAAGDTIRVRIYKRHTLAGAWIKISSDAAWTFAGVQDPAGKIIDPLYSQYGVRVTMEHTVVAAAFNVIHEWFDMKRGT